MGTIIGSVATNLEASNTELIALSPDFWIRHCHAPFKLRTLLTTEIHSAAQNSLEELCELKQLENVESLGGNF